MKRIVLSIVVLLILLCGVAVAEGTTIVAEGNCGASGSNVTWTLDSEGTLTIKGEGEMLDYSEYLKYYFDQYAPWYSQRASINAAVIGEGVTSIGNYAFQDCSSLSSITIPEGVTSIGNGAFQRCDSLSSVTIPEGVTSIGEYAFFCCNRLSSITIPETVNTIKFSAFSTCPELKQFNVVEGSYAYRWLIVNGYLGDYVAKGACGDNGMNLIWTLDSEGTLTISGEGAMEDYSSCSYVPWYRSYSSSIETVVIESGVTSIGSSAFWGCSSLISITIPDGVTNIGNSAFSGCSRLSSITIPEGVTSIGLHAFYKCGNLSSITIPDGVTSIGERTFYNCSSLSSITIPDSVTSIGWGAFYSCSSLSSITIPEGVTSIGGDAFAYCSNLSSIDLTAGVLHIGSSAFYECSSLDMIFVDSLEGWLNISFSGSYATPLYYGGTLYIADELPTDLVLPKETIQINSYAFYNCSSLRSISLPAELTGTTISENVTSIGSSAFYNCSSLRSIAIPEGVTSIGSSAFYNCSSLRSIVIPEGVTSIGNGAFQRCSSLSSITIPDGVTSIGSSAFEDCSSLTSIVIPEGVTSIGSSAFEDCSSLTSIGTYAFRNCSSLRSITIPEGVTDIGSYAFAFCRSLHSITIPEGVTSIGQGAFYSCSSLSSITIPAGVAIIGVEVFSNCRNLSSVTIPEGVTSISEYAFNSCNSLCRISLPASLHRIDNYAFKYCDSHAIVLFRGYEMPALGSDVFSDSPTIYCYEYSDVDFWATEKGYTCIYIDGKDLNRPMSIDLPENMRLELGKSYTVKPMTFPQNANQGIVWQSSDPSIVSVENGVLTALAVGEATITASCDDISDQMTVTVYAPVESFELSKSELWIVGKETAQLRICDMQPAEATVSFTWESFDTSVLTVDGGKITALKPGDATVTATADNGIARSCLVHVCYPVTAIALEQSKYQLTVGEDAQITANVTTRNQSYVNRLVKFESSDGVVATVDASGNIHAVSAGTATITVSATSGVSATCTVTVEPCTHTPVTDSAVPATHVTTGLTEGSHCAVCGEILVEQKVVPVVEVEKVVLPAELKAIEEDAFAGGTFACVVLPDGCKAIRAGAFRDCAQLRFIEIPTSVTSIDSSAFDGCGKGLIIVTVSGSEAERFANVQGIICVLC